jgi:hypothetical protein
VPTEAPTGLVAPEAGEGTGEAVPTEAPTGLVAPTEPPTGLVAPEAGEGTGGVVIPLPAPTEVPALGQPAPTGPAQPVSFPAEEALAAEPAEAEAPVEAGAEVAEEEAGVGITRVCVPVDIPETIAPPSDLSVVERLDDFAGLIRVRWALSPDDGPTDGPVELYRVTYRVGDSDDWIPVDDVPRQEETAVILGAALEVDYTVRVVAVSYEVEGGGRVESEPLEGGPFRVRSLPETLAPPTEIVRRESVQDFFDQGSITLTWTRSADDGGGARAVAEYRVMAREDDGDFEPAGVVKAAAPPTFRYEDTRLGHEYTLRVVAVSATRGEEHVESEPVEVGPYRVRELPEVLAPPIDASVVPGPQDFVGVLELTWTASADDGGGTNAVQVYQVQIRGEGEEEWHPARVQYLPEGKTEWEVVAALPAGVTRCQVVTSGAIGDSFALRLRAVSPFVLPEWIDPAAASFRFATLEWRRVASEWVETGPVEIRALPDTLAAPSDLTIEDEAPDWGGVIVLGWTPSADEGGGQHAVAEYQVEYRPVSDGEAEPSSWTRLESVPAGATELRFEQAGRGVTYQFRVRAASVITLDFAGFLRRASEGEPLGHVDAYSQWVESPPAEATAELLADALEDLGDVVVKDKGWDDGGALEASWTAAEAERCRVTDYLFLGSAGPGKPWTLIGRTEDGDLTEATIDGLDPKTSYEVLVVAQRGDVLSVSAVQGPVEPATQWFNVADLWILLLGIFICFFIVFFINLARRGKDLFIRKIAGLEAVDEAIGRATEMGRPILFVPGIMDMDNVQTLAGLTILGHTAKMAAEYDTALDVPVSRSLVMTAGREVIKQAFLEAGRPDGYNDNMVHYLTDEQFGYVAGVNGIIVRDEPATCFYMGAFYAESLILAETGNSAGAIQIAGTAMPAQLPFFVAACDYTLIGEEIFAASAYLSHDPKQLGSLKGQDVGKLIAMGAIVLGSLFASLHHLTDVGVFDTMVEWLRAIFK